MARLKPTRLDKIFTPWERGFILDILIKAAGNELPKKIFQQKTGLPADLLQYHLDFFTRIGMFEKQIVEEEEVYRLRTEERAIQALKEIFELWFIDDKDNAIQKK